MKKLLKKIMALFLSTILTCGFSFTSLAAKDEAPPNKDKTSYVFDLNNKSEQVYLYYDTEGNEITIGIKPSYSATRSSEPWFEGTWDVYLTGPLSLEYKIDISSSGKITDAYDEQYTAIGVTVTSDALSHTSSKATYKLKYKIADPLPEILSGSGSLYATISGSNLVVTNSIYSWN